MIKSNKGISLLSLVITILIMTIIASVTINKSKDRYEINNINKMINDIELLEDKVSNYYLKYNVIPIVRDKNNNQPIEYEYSTILFDTDINDDEVYYILDIAAMDGITLNYGKDGFENLNVSDDVYIINKKTHNIYYVEGIELDGIIYHSMLDSNEISDKIPPSKPQIKIVSGTMITDENENEKYTTAVEIEVIPGKDKGSGVYETTATITKDNEAIDIETLKQDNGLYRISENGLYVIAVTTRDNSKNESTTEISIVIEIP